MTYCGHRPGLCGRKPDCADHHCPGRPCGLHQHDGGHEVAGEVSVRQEQTAHPTAQADEPGIDWWAVAWGVVGLTSWSALFVWLITR